MKRLVLLGLLSTVAWAQGPYYGRFEFQLQNGQGQAISGAAITVFTQSACGAPPGSPAVLYAAPAGGMPLTQPLHTNGLGSAFAYALPGCYTVIYSSPSTGTLTRPDQIVGGVGPPGPSGPAGPQGPPGTAGNPAGPSFAVNFANSGATGFQGDSSILINPTNHSFVAPIIAGFEYATGFGNGSNNGISTAAASNQIVVADPSYPTTEQYSPTAPIPNWPNFTLQDLRGGHNLYLTHNPPPTYQPYGDGNNTDTLYVTQHDGAPVWPGDLYQVAYRMVLNSNTPGGNFDFPAYDGLGWQVSQALSVQCTILGGGIDECADIGNNKMGDGDQVALYLHNFSYNGGATGLSDEGKKVLGVTQQQVAAEYSGTCTSGCSTGSVHVVTACRSSTNACNPIVSGTGGYLVDSTQTPLSNTITNMVNSPLNTTTMSQLTMGTTVPISNGWGTQTANIATPNRMYCYYSISSLTAVATASGGNSVYTGAITNGLNNALAGCAVNVTGFGNSANNGAFTVTSSTATTLTLANASGSAQSGSATSTVYPMSAMETFSITLVGGSGFDTTHSLCFATQYHECVVPTTVVNAGGGTWTITAPLRHGHASGGYVFQGGMAGYAMEITAYTPTSGAMTYRYLFDVLGSTDASTLQTTWWFQGKPSVLTRLTNLNVNNSLYGCSNVSSVTNTGTAVTATFLNQCATGLALPDYTGGTFYFTNGSNATINGNCTGVAWSTISTFSCTNATATGSNTGLTATIQIGKAGQSGINAIKLWPMAEILDVQDYSTVPPAVNGTLTLEPNPNLVISSTDVLEEQRVAADITNGAVINNNVINPYQLEAGAGIGMNNTPGVVGTGPQGGGLSTTSNASLNIGGGNVANLYKGAGGFFIPVNMVNLSGPYNIAFDFDHGPQQNQGLITLLHTAAQVNDPIYCYRLWNIFEVGNAPFYLQNCPNSSAVQLTTSGQFTLQSVSNIFTGSTSLNGPLNSINNANISTTGGFISGQGINYAPYSNTLTSATWILRAGAGSVACAITDDLGNPACTMTSSASTYDLQDSPASGYTTLTLNTQYVECARMRGHVGGELVSLGVNQGFGGNVFLTTSWVNYCVTNVASNAGQLTNFAAINLNANGVVIDVSNVVVAPGASITPTLVPITTSNNQFLTLTNVNHAGTMDASNYTTNGAPLIATCGTTTTCANAGQSAARFVHGNVALSGGTAVVASMTPWTATTSFDCTGTDKTSAAAVQIVNTSTTSITITGTGTDVIAYVCVGN